MSIYLAIQKEDSRNGTRKKTGKCLYIHRLNVKMIILYSVDKHVYRMSPEKVTLYLCYLWVTYNRQLAKVTVDPKTLILEPILRNFFFNFDLTRNQAGIFGFQYSNRNTIPITLLKYYFVLISFIIFY